MRSTVVPSFKSAQLNRLKLVCKKHTDRYTENKARLDQVLYEFICLFLPAQSFTEVWPSTVLTCGV